MVTKLTILVIIAYLHRAQNTPLRQFREPKAAHAIPLLIPHQPSETLPTTHVIHTPPRVKKSPNIISLPISQIIVPNLHVIPLSQSNVHHSAVHTDVKHIITNDNIKIPVISQTVSHTSSNITHPTPSNTVLTSYTHNVIPLHDLSVIPLQKSLHTIHKVDPKTGHYRLMESQDGDMNDEPVNLVRSIYGGFGTSLYFGGQGAGHGFHIFG